MTSRAPDRLDPSGLSDAIGRARRGRHPGRPFCLRNEHLRLVAAQLGGTGFVGLAALISTRLDPDRRGELYAVVASATLAAVLGAFSLDTVLLLPACHSTPRALRRAVALSVLGSSVAGAVVALVSGVPVPLVALGALLLTSLQLVSAQLFYRGERSVALLLRALAGLLVCGCYVSLLISGDLAVGPWIAAWLTAYGVAVLVGLLCLVLRARAVAADALQDAGSPGLVRTVAGVHTGVAAQMVTARLDQVLLARHSFLVQLGQYSLAASAAEFAQAGAMVRLQSILADARSRFYSRRSLATGYLNAVLVGVLVLGVSTVLLLVIGRLSPAYATTVGFFPYLGAASLLACTSKVGSALLVSVGKPHLPAMVAAVVAAIAAALYVVLIPSHGAYGAAVATLIVSAVHAGLTGVLAWRGAARSEAT